VCTDPAPATTEPVAAPPLSTGWALGGAIAGFVSLLPINGLGISAAVIDEEIPSIPMGAVATVLIATMGPIAAGAGKSARRGGMVRGSIGLRVTGWVFYGITLLDAVVLIGLGAAGEDVDPWQGGLTVAFGNIAIICLSSAALVARGQVKRKMLSRSQAASRNHRSMVLMPTAAPVVGHRGLTGGVFGLGGAF
jgi:hypothetical protein